MGEGGGGEGGSVCNKHNVCVCVMYVLVFCGTQLTGFAEQLRELNTLLHQKAQEILDAVSTSPEVKSTTTKL